MNKREGKGKGVKPGGSVVGTLDQFLTRATSELEHEIELTEQRLSLEPLLNKRSSLGGMTSNTILDQCLSTDKVIEITPDPDWVPELTTRQISCESEPETVTICTTH